MHRHQTRKRNRQPIIGVRGFFVRGLGESVNVSPSCRPEDASADSWQFTGSPGRRVPLRDCRRVTRDKLEIGPSQACPPSNSYPQPGLAVARPYRAHQASIHLRCGGIVNSGNRGKAATFLQHRLNVPTGHGWAALRMGYSGVSSKAQPLSER